MAKKIIPIPPGHTIAEHLKAKGMSKRALCVYAGLHPDFVDRLIEGKEDITANIAYKLAIALRTSMDFWLILENDYRDAIKAHTAQLEKEVHNDISGK